MIEKKEDNIRSESYYPDSNYYLDQDKTPNETKVSEDQISNMGENFEWPNSYWFIAEMCKEFVTDYEFVKVNNHKSHLLINCTDLEKLVAEMESPFAKEWDKKNNCKDTVYSIELVG